MGDIYSWGNNYYGQCFHSPGTKKVPFPKIVTDFTSNFGSENNTKTEPKLLFSFIACGGNHSIAITGYFVKMINNMK
jgi:hypothetical protein